MQLKIYRMNPLVPMLSYGTEEAACFDIAACLEDRPSVRGYYSNNESVVFICLKNSTGATHITIPPRSRVLVPTGMVFDKPKDHSVRVYARSGLSIKQGLAMANGVGIIDSDYVEEVFVPMINNSDMELEIKHGDRIAQGEIVFGKQASLSYIQDRPQRKSDRNGGFGSTGVS